MKVLKISISMSVLGYYHHIFKSITLARFLQVYLPKRSIFLAAKLLHKVYVNVTNFCCSF